MEQNDLSNPPSQKLRELALDWLEVKRFMLEHKITDSSDTILKYKLDIVFTKLDAIAAEYVQPQAEFTREIFVKNFLQSWETSYNYKTGSKKNNVS